MMKHPFTRFLISLVVLFSIIPISQAFAAPKEVTLSEPWVNLRSGPGLTYDIIERLETTDTLQVLETEQEWFKIEYKGKKGWIASWLTNESTSDSSTIEASQEIQLTADEVDFRLGPSEKSNILAVLAQDTTVEVLQEKEDWLFIRYDQQSGWVQKVETNYSTTNASPPPVEDSDDKDEINANLDHFKIVIPSVNVRSNKGLKGKVIGTVQSEERFPILSINHNWVEIQYTEKKTGWLSLYHGQLVSNQPDNQEEIQSISIVTDRTNFRSEPTTHSAIVKRATIGEVYKVIGVHEEWLEVEIEEGSAFVASWVVAIEGEEEKEKEVVEVNPNKKASIDGTLQDIVIVVDAGHGGHDKGTSSQRGTDEKDLTLRTAHLLVDKLEAAGATVIMTRESDQFVALRNRTQLKLTNGADAMISLHYDANLDSSVRGHTTFYYHEDQLQLAQAINQELAGLPTTDRGVQKGNFQIVRDGGHQTVLLELGFLTNSAEEQLILTSQYQERTAQAIYSGLLNYFNE